MMMAVPSQWYDGYMPSQLAIFRNILPYDDTGWQEKWLCTAQNGIALNAPDYAHK